VLKLNVEKAGPWRFDALHFSAESWAFRSHALGLIGNSVTTGVSGRQRTAEWKTTLATSVRAARPAHVPSEPERYAISIGFSFHLPSHGNHKLDIENFMKPTLDAIACGLFCARNLDLATVARWHFDDARFAHLLVHRLPDAKAADHEGAAIFISGK
jgi:hypothetical protein